MLLLLFKNNKEEHLFVYQNLFSEIRPGVDIKTNSPRNPADNCRVEALLCFSPDHDCCNLQICCHPSKICRRIFFPSLCGRSRWWYILRTQRRCNNTLGKFWNIFNKRQLIYMMLRTTGLEKYGKSLIPYKHLNSNQKVFLLVSTSPQPVSRKNR